MNNRFPRSFYFKLTFIMIVLMLTYARNQSFIQASLNDETLNFSQSVSTIIREVMQLPEQSSDSQMIVSDVISEHAQPGNQEPYQIDESILNYDNYITAKQIAADFNSSLNNLALNDAFIKQVNHMRAMKDWNPMNIGYHLEEGVLTRVKELGEYHYLDSVTIDGLDFRTQFPQVENAEYRLGENLYELYISAGDIHLSTWENPKILADYLFDVYADAISLTNYNVYQSQYISVYAEPTDYNVNEVPYIRLVVSLIMDTESDV